MSVDVPVLVSEDTIYRESRIDHGARLLLLQRPKVLSANVPYLSRLSVPRPSPTLFEDRFVGVYPVLEGFSPFAKIAQSITPIVSCVVPVFVSEDTTFLRERIDQGILHRFRSARGVPTFVVFPYTFEVPDLTSDEWVPWVHPAPTPESMLFPFRQIPAKRLPGQPPPLLWYKAPNWKIEAEATTPHAPPGDLSGFRSTLTSQAPITPPVIERVKAVQVGQYLNITRNIGDVFDVDVSHFADSVLDYIVGQIGRPFFGWMIVVSPSASLFTSAPTPLNAANLPRTVL